MNIWVAESWQAPVPLEFKGLKFTKSGWFDRRRPANYYAAFREWIAAMDAAASR